MAYFNFLRLIQKYTSEFKLLKYQDGYYNDLGEYVQNDVTEDILCGAIINFKESKIYRSEGTLTSQDKRLFTLKPICNNLERAIVIHNGKKYNVEESKQNAKFTDVYSYILRYVSVFDDGVMPID